MSAIRNVIVTGANRGIGFEFIKQLLSLAPPPKNVIATTRSDSEELNKLVTSNNGLHVVKYDASAFETYPAFVKQVQSIVGDEGVDLLVNNAGIYVRGNLETITPNAMTTNFEVNTVGPLILTKELLPLLKLSAKNNRKTVVANITSLMGSVEDNGSGSHYAYRASKAALNMVSKSLAIDLKNDKIIVLIVHPGHVKTDMGGNGKIDTFTCVSNILNVIHGSDMSKSGAFVNYDGKPLPW